jgi:hypothetical protein
MGSKQAKGIPIALSVMLLKAPSQSDDKAHPILGMRENAHGKGMLCEFECPEKAGPW